MMVYLEQASASDLRVGLLSIMLTAHLLGYLTAPSSRKASRAARTSSTLLPDLKYALNNLSFVFSASSILSKAANVNLKSVLLFSSNLRHS